ncbi:2-phospho-L-lactate guanylyltransferase CofC [Pseudarthrobacter siccitolerans]|uniref:2-phospho-L-lactate guanylyltransferase CofC n=1 Tax=Pseudarthrobacter siccitolerans TaxID=861266 RepID=A0A024H8G5_9MICC|nr:2-phospho-L-lactate guanylyltransferase [Pseudarthrobacter siccitolerans]CCQ48172.1 2-phospho-L-lactate guanylyltransferase CofC [Pseudarthrobacter siccitolerans]
MTDTWTIVIPAKGTAAAKSRLGGNPGLAQAIALDTVAAALPVGRVIVVTSAAAAAGFRALGAETLQDPGRGLSAAVLQGIEAAGTGRVAVLQGDLPALTSIELESALWLASATELTFVADAAGTGTTLITALDPKRHRPMFGEGSRAAHAAAGYVELSIDKTSGLRSDVDIRADLERLEGRLGRRTAEVLATIRQSARRRYSLENSRLFLTGSG